MPKGIYPRKKSGGGGMETKHYTLCAYPGCTNRRFKSSKFCVQHRAGRQRAVESPVAPQVEEPAVRPLGPVVVDPEPARRCSRCGLRRPLWLFDHANEHPEYQIYNYVCGVCDGTWSPESGPLDPVETMKRQLVALTAERDQLRDDIDALSRRPDPAIVERLRKDYDEAGRKISALDVELSKARNRLKHYEQRGGHRPPRASSTAPDDAPVDPVERLQAENDILTLQNERLTRDNDRLQHELHEAQIPRADISEPFVIAWNDESVNVLRVDNGRKGSACEWVVMVGGKEVKRGQSPDRAQAEEDGWLWVRDHRQASPQGARTRRPADGAFALPAETSDEVAS